MGFLIIRLAKEEQAISDLPLSLLLFVLTFIILKLRSINLHKRKLKVKQD
jgi:hypothetical protein